MRFRILLLCDPRLKKEEGGAEASGAELAPAANSRYTCFRRDEFRQQTEWTGGSPPLAPSPKTRGKLCAVFFSVQTVTIDSFCANVSLAGQRQATMPRQTTEPRQWAHTHIWATTFCRNCGLLQSLSGPGTSIILPLTSLDFPYRETEMFPLQIAPASALEENVRCTCSEK